MIILGISAYFHDAAACLLQDGVLVAAAQEERFTRKKHDARFPENAIRACLAQAKLDFCDIDYVGFYEKPHKKFDRILSMYAEFFPKGYDTFKLAIPTWANGKLWLPGVIRSRLLEMAGGRPTRWNGDVIFSEHHQAHAASAFYPSPFQEASILTMDGVGEWATTSLSVGRPDHRQVPKIEILSEIAYPHSLGMLYSAFTAYLGFRVGSGEYKVMGLAPYGEPIYVREILEHLIDVKDDGSYRLNMDYFSFPYDHVMVTEKFHQLFGLPPRTAEALLTQKHFDIAASLQKVCDLVVIRTATHLHALTGIKNLCMAGGVALNCVANGELWRKGPYTDIWIQPAAGDAGGSVGVAYYIWHDVLNERKHAPPPGQTDLMQGALLGTEHAAPEVRALFDAKGIAYQELEDGAFFDTVAGLLADELIVGWFQGRMEFGPRALGARSILGDPRSKKMQQVMNLKIKNRESFRPFAPSVLRENVADWFDLSGKEGSLLGSPDGGYDSPYMLLVAPVRKDKCIPMTEEQNKLFGIDKLNVTRSEIPSSTHVDYSARIQTVSRATNPRYHDVIEAFRKKTGVALLVNTSFNVRGEPIVCTPADALNCFLGTDIDVLAIGNILVHKKDIGEKMKLDYKNKFSPD